MSTLKCSAHAYLHVEKVINFADVNILFTKPPRPQQEATQPGQDGSRSHPLQGGPGRGSRQGEGTPEEAVQGSGSRREGDRDRHQMEEV